MKFRLSRISHGYARDEKDPAIPGAYKEDGKWYLDVTTVEQLWSLVGPNTDPTREDHYAWDSQLVILDRDRKSNEPEIEIYDDWRE